MQVVREESDEKNRGVPRSEVTESRRASGSPESRKRPASRSPSPVGRSFDHEARPMSQFPKRPVIAENKVLAIFGLHLDVTEYELDGLYRPYGAIFTKIIMDKRVSLWPGLVLSKFWRVAMVTCFFSFFFRATHRKDSVLSILIELPKLWKSVILSEIEILVYADLMRMLLLIMEKQYWYLKAKNATEGLKLRNKEFRLDYSLGERDYSQMIFSRRSSPPPPSLRIQPPRPFRHHHEHSRAFGRHEHWQSRSFAHERERRHEYRRSRSPLNRHPSPPRRQHFHALPSHEFYRARDDPRFDFNYSRWASKCNKQLERSNIFYYLLCKL